MKNRNVQNYSSFRNIITLCLIFVLGLMTTTTNAQSEKVQLLANASAEKLMDQVCPLTGYNPFAKVTDVNYNAYSDELEIKIEAYWVGRTCFFCDQVKFNIDGVITVDENGWINFKTTYKNSAVEDVEVTNLLVGGALVLGYIAVKSDEF